MKLAERIETVEALDDILTEPQPALVEYITTLTSPLVILGAGGKMGPTLARLAKRAAEASGHPLEIVALSRFSDVQSRQWLEIHGVKTLSCDLFDRDALKALPESENVIYLV